MSEAIKAKQERAMARIAEAVGAYDRFLIVAHQRPDLDALGSQLALAHALADRGKTAWVRTAGPVMKDHMFLPGIECVERSLDNLPDAQATFLLDCSTPGRVGRGFEPAGMTICIDHHETNNSSAEIDLIDPSACSTGELIFHLFERMGVALTRRIAVCLYAAVLTDTGGFRYANTTASSLAMGARLVEAGASPYEIATECYERREPMSLKLTGEALRRLQYECDGALCWTEITNDMYEAVGGRQNEPEDLASQLRAARGVKVAALLKQTETGLRVSLRGRNGARVDLVANRLGGGGHRNAAGIDRDGDYEALKRETLEALRADAPSWDGADADSDGRADS